MVEIDAKDGKVTRTVRTARQGTHMVVAAPGGKVAFATPGPPPGPAGVAVSADGRTAYCTVFFSKAVAVVDLTAGFAVRCVENKTFGTLTTSGRVPP